MLWLDLVGLLGQGAVCVMVVVLALLSRRLGNVTHARPYYRGLYLAAVMMGIGIAARFYYLTNSKSNYHPLNEDVVYILLCEGLPALAITLALLVTWYYWSWLLAERD